MRIIPGFRSTRSYLITAAVAAKNPDGQPARMAPERIHIVTRPDARLSARAPRRGAPLPAALQRARLVHGAGIRRRACTPSWRRAPRRQDQHRRPAAGQGAAAIRPADPAAGLFPARSGARPEGARRLGLADRAAGAGPPAGRFRPGGPHRRQHRRHRARARRNRDAVRRAGVRRRPRRNRRGAWSRAAAAPAPRPTRRSTRFLRPSTWSPRSSWR